ncbi:H-NS histone family protein [Eleftheria terrae]|uniref:H-NS histone family protein n=1 Tax=Eleftheria terrae TaxID=1597781 RepID=UPI00263B6F85|nr:H-NS histone family protein [Eleftheria terrae]WKB55979.1 H-NS histone family protein [Eleftheria terrae]
MPKPYAQLRNEMEALQRRMEAARRKEGTGALKEIKRLVALYGFKAEDVFDGEKARARNSSTGKASQAEVPKYQDARGNSWSGRGPRPRWLREALERGEARRGEARRGDRILPRRSRGYQRS